MNTFEFNKFFGAATAALLAFLLAGFFAEELYHVHEAEELAYGLEIAEAEAAGGAEPEVDFASLLQNASAEAGERSFRKCSACHSLDEGVNGVGPHLHDVVGRAIDAVDGYDYSGALEEQGDAWTFDNLNHFLQNPQGWAPGTKMGFAGLPSAEERANVIVYLNEVGGSPEPLPEPAAAPAEAAEAPPEGEQAAAGETEAAEAGAAAEDPTGQAEVDPTAEGTAEAALAETGEGAAEAGSATAVSQAPSGANAAVNENETPGETGTTMEPATPGAAEAPGTSDAPAAEPTRSAAEPTLETALASASAEQGEAAFEVQCALCHTVEEDAHGVGPSLHGVIGREIASAPFYTYSEELASLDGSWTPPRLDSYVAEGAEAPGGHGGYAGAPALPERAAILAYVHERSGGDAPLTAGSAGTAPEAVEDAGEQAASVVEEAAAETGEAAEDAAEAAGGALQAVEEGAETALESAEEGVETAAEVVADGAGAVAEAVEEGAASAAEAVGGALTSAGEALEEGAGEVGETAKGAAEATGEALEEAGEAVAPASEEAPAEAAPAAGGEASSEFAAALAAVDASAGERIWRQCQACHRLEDGRNGVGPHLHDVVGRDIASVEDYSYSDALQEKGGVWDWEALNGWLENPREWAPGNKMVYRGLSDIEDRAAVVKYINEQGSEPQPYP